MVVAGALAALVGVVIDGMGPLDGLVYDLSLAVSGSRPGRMDEPVALIALDRDSLDSGELAALPRVF